MLSSTVTLSYVRENTTTAGKTVDMNGMRMEEGGLGAVDSYRYDVSRSGIGWRVAGSTM
jgi:hypothetical protein